jgi:patatin-like phospholipase
MDDPDDHAGLDRRQAMLRLGGLGLAGVAASSLLGAATAADPSEAAKRKAPRRPFRIVSFCGGGIRGVASAAMLARVAREAPQIVAKADLLAGTSIGATIVGAIVAGVAPAQLSESLLTGGLAFYAVRNTDPTRPAYDVDRLAALQLALHPGNPPLRKLPRKVLFTAFDVGAENRPWRPLLLNNLSKSTTAGTGIVDAIVSSAAMPGMLGSYHGHIDGAFVDHDPTLAAIALAVDEGVRLEDISVVCFGTGLMPAWIASDTADWGAQQWQNGDGNPANRTPAPLINGTEAPVVSARLDGPSTSLTPQLSRLLLGSRYAYANPVLDRAIAEDDRDPADLAYLQSQAAKVDVAHAVRLVKRYWR